MQLPSPRILAASTLLVAIVAACGTAVALSEEDAGEIEQPITGEEADKASEAALEHTGGGEVTDTEKYDEEGMYEVEVTLENGDEVDVQLDGDFEVISTEREPGDDEPGDPED